jgi:hypothetical protein
MKPSAAPHITSCQSTQGSLATCSSRYVVPSYVRKLTWCLRSLGPAHTMHLAYSKLGRVLGGESRKNGSRAHPPLPAGLEENLGLRPGEVVEVKSEAEILATLDERGRHRGLLWMPNMARFCGKRYRVLKRMESIMLESTGELRKIRNTVLLEGAMCEDLYGCDRSCFHYWRETWLRRVL